MPGKNNFYPAVPYRAVAGQDDVLRLVLVPVGVAADADGLGPPGDQAGDGLAQDRLSEDGASLYIPGPNIFCQYYRHDIFF